MMLNPLQKIRADERGTAIIEFALLAPVVLGLFFGLIQIGISMMAYNSLRGVASDTARYAMVEYLTANTVSDATIAAEGKAIATSAPYLLNNSVNVTITPVTTSRVHGTFEKTLTITYTPPEVLPFFNFTSKQMSYSRPLFMIDE